MGRRSMTCAGLLAAVVAGVLLAAAVAQAQAQSPATQQALDRFARGQAFYQAADYTRAAEEFAIASALLPDPVIKFWGAQSHYMLRNWQRSAELLREYLAAAPNAPNRATAEQMLRQCVNAAPPLPPPPPIA